MGPHAKEAVQLLHHKFSLAYNVSSTMCQNLASVWRKLQMHACRSVACMATSAQRCVSSSVMRAVNIFSPVVRQGCRCACLYFAYVRRTVLIPCARSLQRHGQ